MTEVEKRKRYEVIDIRKTEANVRGNSEKNVIFIDEDDNVLGGTAPIQFKIDRYAKESAKRIALGLKREYFRKKEKESGVMLVDNAGRYIKKAVMPVFYGDKSPANLGGVTVYVDSEELAEVLESLNERQAKIIYLIFFMGENPGNAAKKMNMKRKNFYKNKEKAMKKIRKGLEKKGYER